MTKDAYKSLLKRVLSKYTDYQMMILVIDLWGAMPTDALGHLIAWEANKLGRVNSMLDLIYFLQFARGWKGEEATIIKRELRRRWNLLQK